MSSLIEHVEKLNCLDEAERICAAEDIGYLNSADGVPALFERLRKEPSRAVREAIFQALIRIEADAAIEVCIGLLDSEDPQLRNQAVDVLRHKGAAAFPFLATVMREGDKDLRKLVLDILSEVDSSGAEAIYEVALSDQDTNVVITAVENTAKTRAVQFRQRIEVLLSTASQPMLIGVCLEALGGIGNEGSLATIRLRFPVLATVPDFLLMSCLKAFGALGSEIEFAEVVRLLPLCGRHLHAPILDALIAIHQRQPEGLSANANGEELLAPLQAVVENGSLLCRYQAVLALGFLSSKDNAYSFLVTCLSNPERMVRRAAIESLRANGRAELKNTLAARALEETDEDVLHALRS
jgi:HEAT repeat protein